MASLQEHVYNRSPAWIQNLLVSAYGYRLYRKRYSGKFNSILDLVRESRQWSSQQADSWQAERLHNIIKHCRQSVPYYQKLLASYGLHENDFTSIEDVRKLPILTKKALREHQNEFHSTASHTYMVQHTSGSTGTPLALAVDEYTYKLAMALVVDHEEYHGVPFGSRRATFAGRMIQPPGDMTAPFSRYNWSENQRLYSSYHLNEKTFPEYRRDLDRFSPQEIIGYPSAISDLAGYYLKFSQRPAFRPTSIITNSETLLSWQRESIEKAFQAPVFDYYGTAEYVAFAGQDKSGDYKPNRIIGLLELDNGHPESSQAGALIATSLSNYTMPLLRYHLGDTAVASKREDTLPVRALASIEGRIDDYIVTPDGRNIGRVDHFFKGLSDIREAQVIQDRTDHCTILVVANNDISEGSLRRLSENIESRLGKSMHFDINTVPSIKRGANGKFKSVIRELG